jgi:hypothetical protein
MLCHGVNKTVLKNHDDFHLPAAAFRNVPALTHG